MIVFARLYPSIPEKFPTLLMEVLSWQRRSHGSRTCLAAGRSRKRLKHANFTCTTTSPSPSLPFSAQAHGNLAQMGDCKHWVRM